jgi:hypothetical protein
MGEPMTTGAKEKMSARAHRTRQPGRRVGVDFSRPSVECLPKSVSLGRNGKLHELETWHWHWAERRFREMVGGLPSIRSAITSGYVVS